MNRHLLKFVIACAIVVATSLSGSPSFAENVTVRASIQSPAKATFSKVYDWLLVEIEKATEGRVKFERYYSGSLAKPNEQLRAASTGLAGMSLVVPSYVPAQLPLANVGSNPALWNDSWTGSKAYSALYAQQPAMAKELDKHNVKLISAYTTPTYYVLGRKIDLDNLKQIKGMRIMTSGQIAVLLQSLGAQIVSISTPEGYEALQRGTVDGAVYGISSAATYGIPSVVQSLWELPVGGLPLIVVMNKDVWNSISKKDQEAILNVAKGHPQAFYEIYEIGGDKKALEKFKAANVKIIKPDAESLKQLRVAAEKIWTKWAKEQDAAGRPGSEVLNAFVKLTEEYAAKSPAAGK